MCRHWQTQGNCQQGDQCLFAHGDHELRKADEVSNQLLIIYSPFLPRFKLKPNRSAKLSHLRDPMKVVALVTSSIELRELTNKIRTTVLMAVVAVVIKAAAVAEIAREATTASLIIAVAKTKVLKAITRLKNARTLTWEIVSTVTSAPMPMEIRI
jgi:Zinc finger domain